MSEAYWRANQRAFIQRIREIESRQYGYSPLISYAWEEHFAGWFRSRDGMWQPRAAIPHVVILVAALGVAVALKVAPIPSVPAPPPNSALNPAPRVTPPPSATAQPAVPPAVEPPKPAGWK